MACVKPDGSLTETAKVLLRQLENPLTAEEIAPRINQPLFKVRSVMRELVGNGLTMETDGKFQITSKGKEKMNVEH
jgi:predicted transcriptional regulator